MGARARRASRARKRNFAGRGALSRPAQAAAAPAKGVGPGPGPTQAQTTAQKLGNQGTLSALDQREPSVQSRMSQLFGVPLHDVALRNDAASDARARSAGARAYTEGREIGFARGALAPHTREGQHRVVHEFAHVVQRSGGNDASAPAAKTISSAEGQARQAANVAMGGGRPRVGAFASRAPLFDGPTPGAADAQKRLVPSGYTVPSAQIKQWLADKKDVGYQLHRLHLRTVYPQATEQDVTDCLQSFTWEFHGDVNQALTKANGGPIRLTIDQKFHKGVQAWLKEKKHVDVADLGRVQAGAGGDAESGTGQGGGTGDGSGAGRGPGDGTGTPGAGSQGSGQGTGQSGGENVDAANLEEAAEKLQAELAAKSIASTPRVTATDVDGKTRDWPRQFSDPGQREALLKVMKEIVGEPTTLPPDEASAVPARLSVSEASFLMKIAQSDEATRSSIIAKLKGDGTLKDSKGRSLADTLETAISNVELEKHADEMGVKMEKGPPSTDPAKIPIENRPVRGQLRNLSGELSPNERAVWVLSVDDDRDAFRVPHIYIWWKAVRLNAKDRKSVEEVVSTENTHNIPVRDQSIINDSEFDFTVRTPGPYKVQAIVHHNFFRPAYFEEPFDVEEEKEQSERQFGEHNTGLVDPKKTRFWEEQMFDQGQQFDYRQGWKRYGQFAGSPVATSNEDLAKDLEKQRDAMKTSIDKEIDRLLGKDSPTTDFEARAQQIEKSPQKDKIKAMLEGLATQTGEMNKKIAAVRADGGDTALVVRGQFSSRVRGIDDASMKLSCMITEVKSKVDGRDITQYRVMLHDATSGRGENQVYHFPSDVHDSVEAAQQQVFENLASAYPFGTVNVLFQKYDIHKHKPTSEFVQFKKMTDSTGKDVKSVVFSDPVDTAVNVVGTILSLFPPTSAIGVTMLVVYNTSKSASDNLDDLSTGNFRKEKGAIAVADLALNLLPLAPRVVKVGKVAYYVIKGATVIGSLMLMAAVGLDQVRTLRSSYIEVLAAKRQRYDELMKNNKAHPDIATGSLLKEIKQLEDDTRSATLDVFGQLAAQAIFMHVVSTAVDKGFQSRELSPIETRLLPDLEARRKAVGRLKEAGNFEHVEGARPRYDYANGRIVADESRISPKEFNTVAREANADKALNAAGMEPAQRQKVAKDLSKLDMEIKPGQTTEVVRPGGGGKPELRVKPGASAADVEAALKALPKANRPTELSMPGSFAAPEPLQRGKVSDAHTQTVRQALSERAKGRFTQVEVEIVPEGSMGESKKLGKVILEGNNKATIRFVGEPGPGGLLEEIAHLEQLADPRFAKQAELLTEASRFEWTARGDKFRVEAHKARLELELDAQNRVIGGLEAKANPTQAEVLAIDNAYQNIEQIAAKLAQVNGLQNELATYGGFARRPELLDVTPDLTTKKTKPTHPADWTKKTRQGFIDDYRQRYPDTSLTEKQLADRWKNGQRLNPDTLRLKDPTLADNPVPDIRARIPSKESIPVDDLHLTPKEKAEIGKYGAERDAAIAARDKASAAGNVEEVGKFGAQVNEASRKLGEAHANAYMRENYPGYAREYPKDPGKPSRAGDFDQVWVKRTPGKKGKITIEVIVIEAKGGSSRLGARKFDGLLVEQGSGAYFKSILRNMAESGTDDMNAIATLIGKTAPENISYKVVRAPIDQAPDVGSVVLKIDVGDFDMKTTQAGKK